MSQPPTRRSIDPRQAAEAVFRKIAKPVEEAPKASAIPHAKEAVSLRLDRDVLEAFQQAGPGWQERINAALRSAAGLT